MATEKHGIPAVCEAVTAAAMLLSQFKRQTRPLDDRDRRNCAEVQAMLERAEAVLYGRGPEPDAAARARALADLADADDRLGLA
jgi:hypothetical protein